VGNEVFDRLRQGPQGEQQGKYDNWNEMVGSAPPDRQPSESSDYNEDYRQSRSETSRSSDEGEGFLGKILGNRTLMTRRAYHVLRVLAFASVSFALRELSEVHYD
jgi:hypothetical protein